MPPARPPSRRRVARARLSVESLKRPPPPPSLAPSDPPLPSHPTRYALLEKVRKQGLKIEERYRKNGKGFVKPWEVETKLEEVIDPIAHGKK